MNANVMDYSYSKLDLQFKKVLGDLLTKAVRVTTAVKDKIKNGYKKNFTVAGIENQQVELIKNVAEQVKVEVPKPVESVPVAEAKPIEAVQTVTEVDYLISKTVDESAENLGVLYDKLTELQKQKNVLMVVRRAAAYTKELIAKTWDVTKKWFVDFNKVVSVADAVSPVVMPEMTIPSITPTPNQEPISVPNPSVAPEPMVEPTPAPTAEIVQPINSFSWADVLKPRQEVSVQPEAKTVEIPTTTVNEFKFEMPVFQPRAEANVISPAISAEVPNFEFNAEPTKSNVLPFERPVDGLQSISKKDDGFIGKSEVAARIYRLGETVKEGNARIIKLTAELEAVKAAKDESYKKVLAFGEVNGTLSAKIISLTEQLAKVNSDLERAKEERALLIKSHDEEIARMKAEFDLAIANASEEKATLIADYENRLASEVAKHKADIASLNADYKNTMQAIYTDMQNIQGIDEPTMSREETPDNAYDMNQSYSYEEPVRRMAA